VNGSGDEPVEVDELVRTYLEQQFERLDTSALRSRIPVASATTASLDDSTPAVGTPTTPSTNRSTGRKLTYGLAMSVAVVIAFLGGRYFSPASASAATVLQSVRAVHSQPVDRCYQIHYVPDNRYWDGKNKLLGPSQSLLWTRGDRFLADCRIGDVALAIGRDTDGVLWISPSRKKGIVFEGSDASLPSDLATLCDINTMSLSKLVDDVLADFDLEIEERGGLGGESKSVIWAEPKVGRPHRLIAAAVIEVDDSTNAIERLVIWVLRDGRPNGTVTYSWTETTRQSDPFYAMTSHLDPDAVIDVKQPEDGTRGAQDLKSSTSPSSVEAATASDPKIQDDAPAQRTPR
jgi:hypothetical protein